MCTDGAVRYLVLAARTPLRLFRRLVVGTLAATVIAVPGAGATSRDRDIGAEQLVVVLFCGARGAPSPTELAPFEINPFGRGQGVAAPPD